MPDMRDEQLDCPVSLPVNGRQQERGMFARYVARS